MTQPAEKLLSQYFLPRTPNSLLGLTKRQAEVLFWIAKDQSKCRNC